MRDVANPIRRLKDILGELQRNGRQALEHASLQSKRMAAMERRLAALEEALRQATQHVGEAAVPVAPDLAPNDALLEAYRNAGILNYENSDVSGERRFLAALLDRRPDALVLDVGANRGDYSALVRSLSPRPTIHAFEPHPRAFAALEARAQALGIAAHHTALGDQAGEVSLFDYADEQGSEHASLYREVIEDAHRRRASAVTVPCTTLDAVVEGLGLATIDLVKIDTEGHELAVLKGAARTLGRGAIEVIQFEFNEMNVHSRVFLKDFMALLPGYRFHRLLPSGAMSLDAYDPRLMEIFAFQNVVCVRGDIAADWVVGSVAR
jgi:FkbM family methyltransferase